jgi:competence protein ComEC
MLGALTILCAALLAARRLLLTCVLFLLGLAGIAMQVVHRSGAKPVLTIEDGETAIVDGCVVDPPVFSPDKAQFTLELVPHALARVSVLLKGSQALHLQYGNRVELAAKVRSPHNFQNPGEFDYAAWLAHQQIYWTATVRSTADIQIQPGKCGHPSLGWLYFVRTSALERLESLYPEDTRTSLLLRAVLLGQTAGMQRRWTDDFRVTGTYHALVISGQHVSVLAMTLLFCLRLLNLGRIPSLTLATLASWLYAFIAGLSAPVVRAAGGFTLVLIACYLFRRVRLLNLLSAVAAVYLLFDPDQLFDPSFQLSFLSAAALVALAIPLMERWTESLRIAAGSADRMLADTNRDPRIATLRVELRLFAETLHAWTHLPKDAALTITSLGARCLVFVVEGIIVSACVQFGLALPMITYFHRVSLTGLAANVVVVPLLSIVVPSGFAAILTGWHWLAWLTALFLHWAERVAAWHVQFEPSWRIATVPAAAAVCFAAFIVALAIGLRQKARWTSAACLVSVLAFAIIAWQPWRPVLAHGWLEVSAIDVSQGDSIFVVFPNGETMLVDGGGFPGTSRMARKPNLDIGEDVVSPYLWSRGIKRIDYAVLTHEHSDHMDGLGAIIDNFHPKQLWTGAEIDTPEWDSLRRKAEANRVQIRALRSTDAPMRFGAVGVRVLAPSPEYAPGANAANDDSLVMQITYGSRSVLLTGDAERAIEQQMVTDGQLTQVTLLKVGHHGSRTSTSDEFLQAVHPQFALISAGYLNQFHHPHPGVLNRLAEEHAMVLRTDQRGLLTFRTDGKRVEIETYR